MLKKQHKRKKQKSRGLFKKVEKKSMLTIWNDLEKVGTEWLFLLYV
jgi:hypothetical protein